MHPCMRAAQRRHLHCSWAQAAHSLAAWRGAVRCRAYGCYTAYMPLVGFEAFGFLLQHPSAKPVQHRAVLLGDKDKPHEGCILLDFLPENPTSPATAINLLSGQKAQGTTRIRKVSRFLAGTGIQTEWSGSIHTSRNRDRLVDDVVQFNSVWDHRLHLVDNNCMHYTDALLAFLMHKPSPDVVGHVHQQATQSTPVPIANHTTPTDMPQACKCD